MSGSPPRSPAAPLPDAPPSLQHLLAAKPAHAGACQVVVVALPQPRAGGPGSRTPRARRSGHLGAALAVVARAALRRPFVRQLGLRVLKRFPALYARTYRMMTAPAASHTGAAGASSPRAEQIYQALRKLRTAPAATPARRRLAFVSPLPPERTGVAHYAVELLVELAAHFDIELIVAQASVDLPPALAALPVRQAGWFVEHGGEYDQVLYQFGNSPFHSHMFALLERHPGVVVLHDFFLGGVLAHAQMSGAAPRAWADAMFRSHGYAALRSIEHPDPEAQAHKDWPCSLPVLEAATRTIVHSDHARRLALEWFGPAAARRIDVIPHPRTPPPECDRRAARAALGIDEETFLVCSFGFVAPNKLAHELIQAWQGSPLHGDRRCMLVFVGANHDSPYGVRVSDMIRAGAPAQVRIAGWTADSVYRQYLQAADVGVQLRAHARGESSGAVLDCLNYGLATIVNANGSMSEFPPETVWQLPDAFTAAELGEALEVLWRDPQRRQSLSRHAVELLDARFRPAQCAGQYRATLDQAYADTTAQRAAWALALAQLAPGDEDGLRLAAAGLASAAPGIARRRLLVDASGLDPDNATVMQLVPTAALAQVLALLEGEGKTMCVEPVQARYEAGRWQYRHARNASAKLLGISWPTQPEPQAEANPGDVFYAPDALAPAVIEAARAGLYAEWRARGVITNFFVRELPPRDSAAFNDLCRVGAQADRLLCSSETIAAQLAELDFPARLG